MGQIWEAEMAQSELVLRDWGTTEEVPMREGHQVQQFTVNPGARLPIRVNDFQCEHWVVVKGVGKVYLDAKNFLLDEGGATFIPARASHAIENVGETPLRVIAVHYSREWPTAGRKYVAERREQLKGANFNRA